MSARREFCRMGPTPPDFTRLICAVVRRVSRFYGFFFGRPRRIECVSCFILVRVWTASRVCRLIFERVIRAFARGSSGFVRVFRLSVRRGAGFCADFGLILCVRSSFFGAFGSKCFVRRSVFSVRNGQILCGFWYDVR